MVSRKDVQVPEFYRNYVANAGNDDLQKALRQNTKAFRKLLQSISKKKMDYSYAEGKWTIRQLFQHIIDAERVFVLRALWFARNDTNPLPGFDESSWGTHADVSSRSWKEMQDEFFALRKATEAFFDSLGDEQLRRTGTANNNTMSVAGLGFVCAGHVAHHMNIINDRYLTRDKKEKQRAKKDGKLKKVKVNA